MRRGVHDLFEVVDKLGLGERVMLREGVAERDRTVKLRRGRVWKVDGRGGPSKLAVYARRMGVTRGAGGGR